jgi:PTH2 family peptidyl-tRNA hydrolase
LGTKICLGAKDLKELEKYYGKVRDLPHAWIVDHGHVFPPHFDGGQIVTALGIGPLTPDEAKILRRLKLI